MNTEQPPAIPPNTKENPYEENPPKPQIQEPPKTPLNKPQPKNQNYQQYKGVLIPFQLHYQGQHLSYRTKKVWSTTKMLEGYMTGVYHKIYRWKECKCLHPNWNAARR